MALMQPLIIEPYKYFKHRGFKRMSYKLLGV